MLSLMALLAATSMSPAVAGTDDADGGPAGAEAADNELALDDPDPTLAATSGSVSTSTEPRWLARLHAARANAGLGSVAERDDWSRAAREHARYMLVNGVMTHGQDQALPGASDDGRWAGLSGNLFAASMDLRPVHAVDAWLNSPGHARWVLHPGLKEVGFGEYRDANAAPLRYAAVLPVTEGVDRDLPRPDRVTYPGDGSVLRAHDDALDASQVRTVHLFRPDLGTELEGRVEVRVTVDGRRVATEVPQLRDGYLAARLVDPLPSDVDVAVLVLVDGRFDDRWAFSISSTTSAPPILPQRRTMAPWDLDGTTHETAIRTLLHAEAVSGYPDGSFRASTSVSRGQLATMLDAVLAPEPSGDTVVIPEDASASAHADAIRAVVAAGWMAGGSDGRFRPGDPVTRGQVASTLTAALGLDGVSTEPGGLADVAGTTHEAGILAVVGAELASGYPDSTFRPGAPVSRGQLASILVAGTTLGKQ